jgi:septal ring factor EnvC (AmiA/AmiB activator)
MDVERTIEFILKNQAQMDARFNAKFDRADERFEQAEKRFAQAEKRMDRLDRQIKQASHLVAKLARSGVSLRSDVRKTERNLKKLSESLSENDGKLNALIDFVDRQSRGNGRKH